MLLPKSINWQRMRLLESVSPMKMPSPRVGKVTTFAERRGCSGDDKQEWVPSEREAVLADEAMNGCWEGSCGACYHSPLLALSPPFPLLQCEHMSPCHHCVLS